MDAHGTIAVALSQALAVRDEAALSSCLDGAPAMMSRALLGRLRATRITIVSNKLLLPPALLIAVQEPAVVASSVARLSAAQAAFLLEELLARLHRQPQQAARLAPWLRSLLLSHGATLAASPAGQVSWGATGCSSQSLCVAGLARPTLTGLLATSLLVQAKLRRAQVLLEERTASYSSLLELSGRLAMLQSGASRGADAAATTPAVRFSA